MPRFEPIILAVVIMSCHVSNAAAITCEECKELEAQRNRVTAELRLIDDKLSAALGCPVIPVVARDGKGMDELLEALYRLNPSPKQLDWTVE